jgi:GNAT superfamily N-acetyltransferase
LSGEGILVRAFAGPLDREQAQDLRRSVLCGELHYSRELVDDGQDQAPGVWLGLALDGPKPVGTLRLQRQGAWMLEHLAVLPRWRRQGVGRALVQAAIAAATQAQASEIIACGPETAAAFFRAVGFDVRQQEGLLYVWHRTLLESDKKGVF